MVRLRALGNGLCSQLDQCGLYILRAQSLRRKSGQLALQPSLVKIVSSSAFDACPAKIRVVKQMLQ